MFQKGENSTFVIKTQEVELEKIVLVLNAQNPMLNRTWKEVQKKYYNLASEAKKLRKKQKTQMIVTGSGVVDPDGAAGSYNELPFYTCFTLEYILPAVIVEGVTCGFQSETQSTVVSAEFKEEECDETDFAATQYSTQNVNGTLFKILWFVWLF